MDIQSAYTLAQAHVEDGTVVLQEGSCECPFGYYFPVTTARFLETNRFEDIEVGCGGLLVERNTGEVHQLGSAFDVDYWLLAYERGLHKPQTVIVLAVNDRQRAANALLRLQMTYVIPEVAYGETWRIPRHYGPKDFFKAFDDLPARFEDQNLIFRLHEIQNIIEENDVKILLEPSQEG